MQWPGPRTWVKGGPALLARWSEIFEIKTEPPEPHSGKKGRKNVGHPRYLRGVSVYVL